MTEFNLIVTKSKVMVMSAGKTQKQRNYFASSRIGTCSLLFRVVKTTLSSSYNISGLVPVCWLLFQCF